MTYAKNLIIIEEPLHTEKISEYQGLNGGRIIVFSVPAKLALDKKGIKCYFPDELVELPDLNQIGIDNIERVQKICNFLDMKLHEKLIFLKEDNINLFSASYLTIKIFFDTLFTFYFILERLFNKVNAEKIIIFKKNYMLDRLVRDRDPMILALVENVFSKDYNVKAVSNTSSFFKGSFSPCLSQFKEVAKDVRDILLNRKGKKKYDSNGIILYSSHDIPYLINEILDSVNFSKVHIYKNLVTLYSIRSFGLKMKIISKSKAYSNSIREAFREALSAKQYRDMFVGNDNLFYFAHQCLESYFLQTIGPLLPYTNRIKDRLVELTPKVLLTSACRLGMRDAFILELVRSFKIPIVTYQEGGCAGYMNFPMFNLDMDLSDYFLAYGVGVKESPFIKGKAKIVPVGSIRLANIKKHIKIKTPPQPTIYVVLATFNMGIRQHYPHNGGFFSQVYLHELKILDTLKQFKTVKFVLKTIKGREFLHEPFIDKKFIRIVTKPLTNVLGEASAFILEWPSTALQECLLTNKPIALLYNESGIKFEDKALKLLTKRVRISSNYAQFYEVVNSLIEDIKFGTRMTDENEFLENYCLMKDAHRNIENFFSELGVLKQDL